MSVEEEIFVELSGTTLLSVPVLTGLHVKTKTNCCSAKCHVKCWRKCRLLIYTLFANEQATH